MQKTALLVMTLLLTGGSLSAQKFFTRDGQISFFSDAPLEKIEAHNSSATSVFDAESGRVEFAVLIKGFQFEKALMQEHFNENYLESDKFPKALFKGRITNMEEIDLHTSGTYTAQVSGELTIHGVTQPLETTAQFTVKNGHIHAFSSFEVAVADFGIEIPGIVRDKIAKVVRVDVSVEYQELKSKS